MVQYPFLAWYRVEINQYCFPRPFKTREEMEEWIEGPGGPIPAKRIKNGREESITIYFMSENGSFPTCIRTVRAIPLTEENI